MHTQIQNQLHQLLIDQLTTGQPYSLHAINRNGTMFNALTAHQCVTFPSWDKHGYPQPTKCDILPIELTAFNTLDQLANLPASLRQQAI